MNVVIQYFRSHDAAKQVEERCSSYGHRVLNVSADIGSKVQVNQLKEKLELQHLMPDIVVNNAGVSHYGLFTDMSEQEWDQVINTNLKGAFLCAQAFVPHMIRQRFGRVINISSVWGMTGASCEVAYSASKGAINAMTKAMAKELAPSGITVNAVAPGVVETEMMDQFNDDDKESLRQDIPMGRFAMPKEIASLVYYLSLPESGYLTGQVISPNGGWQL